MTIIRTAVVLSVAIALIPSDKGKQQQLYAQAVGLAQDAASYCDRNPDNCERAARYWEEFKSKAAFAGEIAVNAVRRYAADTRHEGDAHHTGFQQVTRQQQAKHSGRGTLTPHDLAPEWRGDSKRQGI